MSKVYEGVFDEDIKSFSKLTQFTETSKCSRAWNMSECSFDIINQRPRNSLAKISWAFCIPIISMSCIWAPSQVKFSSARIFHYNDVKYSTSITSSFCCSPCIHP